jgi:hypothetical protein
MKNKWQTVLKKIILNEEINAHIVHALSNIESEDRFAPLIGELRQLRKSVD